MRFHNDLYHLGNTAGRRHDDDIGERTIQETQTAKPTGEWTLTGRSQAVAQRLTPVADPEVHSSGRPKDGTNDKAVGTCGISWHGPNGDKLR